MRRMLFFDGRNARRARPVLGEYIRPNVNPRKSNSPSGTLQTRVFSALTVRFSLPIEPDMQISRIRLSDKTSRLRPRLAAPTRGQAYETVMPVEVREWISPALASPELVLVAQPPA